MDSQSLDKLQCMLRQSREARNNIRDKLEQIRTTVVKNNRQLQEMVVASRSAAEEYEALLREFAKPPDPRNVEEVVSYHRKFQVLAAAFAKHDCTSRLSGKN